MRQPGSNYQLVKLFCIVNYQSAARSHSMGIASTTVCPKAPQPTLTYKVSLLLLQVLSPLASTIQ
ncbi:hypothetical protein BV372_21945 [Nostoc sp. T09]|nr:hypothetical protein BV372_21945 [Nostoc sp. T09]